MYNDLPLRNLPLNYLQPPYVEAIKTFCLRTTGRGNIDTNIRGKGIVMPLMPYLKCKSLF